jgi:ubiquinone/menaquinone biosynthesis C-methylase UbiE
MQPRLQRRIQRYGWDLAAPVYESLWQAQLAPAQAEVLACAGLSAGERVIDVACGPGIVTFEAARRVLPGGSVLGVDLSGRMVAAAQERAQLTGCTGVRFERADAEKLDCIGQTFDAALCVLGLMYMPHPELAIGEIRKLLRPGGRLVAAVWGERAQCGWAELFPIVDAEVASDVCPLFFRLGYQDALARLCAGAGFSIDKHIRLASTLLYADEDSVCDAALVGGPVALAWSRLDERARLRVRNRYLESIAPWRNGRTYRIPAEFVVVKASLPEQHGSPLKTA